MIIFKKQFLRSSKEIYSNSIDSFHGIFSKYMFGSSSVDCLLLVSDERLLIIFYTKKLFLLSPFSMSEISLNDIFKLDLKEADSSYFMNILLINDGTLSFLFKNNIKKFAAETNKAIFLLKKFKEK